MSKHQVKIASRIDGPIAKQYSAATQTLEQYNAWQQPYALAQYTLGYPSYLTPTKTACLQRTIGNQALGKITGKRISF